ncbi:MAG: hypothetical protein QMC36_03995 [Patescibacteria group bacterium]
MSAESSEKTYEPALRLDYDLKEPGFFSYVRGAVRGKTANFESAAVSKLLDPNSRESFSKAARFVSETFEKSVSAAEGLADRKKQSDLLSSAVAEFNSAMKTLESSLMKELRAQRSGKAPVAALRSSDDDVVLRSADASRFLEENM